MQYFVYILEPSVKGVRQTGKYSVEKLLRDYAQSKNLKIAKVFFETGSAAQPNRKEFNTMLSGIEAGKAQGILCDSLGNLSRNPVDMGKIQWLFQQNVLRHIITPTQEYKPNANPHLLAIELEMANQFIRNLTQNVKRGLRSKWEQGCPTSPAPLGYLNDQSKKTVVPDPDRFKLVRKIWDTILTGTYNPAQIAVLAGKQWGLTNRRKRSPGKPVSKFTVYRILKNPFYCGEFIAGGKTFKGKYKPMITRKEFDRVQTLLGNRKTTNTHQRP